jgi:hypothetical protein
MLLLFAMFVCRIRIYAILTYPELQILCVRSYEIAAAKMSTKIDQARAVSLMNTTFQVFFMHCSK